MKIPLLTKIFYNKKTDAIFDIVVAKIEFFKKYYIFINNVLILHIVVKCKKERK